MKRTEAASRKRGWQTKMKSKSSFSKVLLVLTLVLLENGIGLIVDREAISGDAGDSPVPWPIPRMMNCKNGSRPVLDVKTFNVVASIKCDILDAAVVRYKKWIFVGRQWNETNDEHVLFAKAFTTLKVSIESGRCDRMPYFGMDENYELDMRGDGSGEIRAQSVWGALRAMETFSQLIVYPKAGGQVTVRECVINDGPRFPHRGVLLDTSRHFLPVGVILETLDLMAHSKYNVFHWHITDDQSFPFQSQLFPELSAKGAYSPLHVYSPAAIKQIIEFARLRGIRVVAEFDTPGHTISWGRGKQELLAKCYDKDGRYTGKEALIDPSRGSSYDFLLALFREILAAFPDEYVHLGGDEASYWFNCWKNNPQIKQFMQLWNITGDAVALENLYFQRFMKVVLSKARKAKTSYIVWQEVLDNSFEEESMVAHIWKGSSRTERQKELEAVTKKGHRILLSSCWYLNDISYGTDWHPYYDCDPHDFNGTDWQKRLVLGGEACMWGEYVDATNLTPRLWPRACVVAEKLWSDGRLTANFETAAPRLHQHRCLLLRRGYRAEPASGPSFCPVEIPYPYPPQ